jgi:hypothetical protein
MRPRSIPVPFRSLDEQVLGTRRFLTARERVEDEAVDRLLGGFSAPQGVCGNDVPAPPRDPGPKALVGRPDLCAVREHLVVTLDHLRPVQSGGASKINTRFRYYQMTILHGLANSATQPTRRTFMSAAFGSARTNGLTPEIGSAAHTA